MSAPTTIAVHDQDGEVWVGEGNQVKAIDVRSGDLRVVLKDDTFRELDVAPDGKSLVATVRGRSGGNIIRFFNLKTGERRDIGRGCSASLSPDGSLATNNVSGHKELQLLRVEDGSRFKSLITPEGHLTE